MSFLVQDGTDIKRFTSPQSVTPTSEFNAKKADGTNPGTGTRATFTDLDGVNNATLNSFTFSGKSAWSGSGTTADPYVLGFDATTNQLVIPVNTNGTYALSFWLNVRTIPTGSNCLFATSVATVMLSTAGNIQCLWPGSTMNQSSVALTANTWYHVVIDQFSKKIYVNGTDVTAALSMGWTPDANTNLSFGKGYYNSNDMAISWIRLYTQAVNQTQVTYDYNAGVTGIFGTSGWSVVGTAPATAAMFTANGFSSFSGITDADIRSLTSNTPKFLEYPSASAPVPSVTAVPNDRIVFPTGDLDLSSADSVASVSITANQTGGGVVRLIVSPDSGTTWYTWNGTTWATIDSTNLATVKASGMTPATVNARVQADWTSLLGTSKLIRFAYYLGMNASSDTANTDLLTMTLNMTGYWSSTVLGTDYTYEYPGNTTLRVKFLVNGDFKVNY